MSTIDDLRIHAIELAKKSPLWRVQMGAIIVKHEEILGEGWGCAIGEAAVHAEFAAIQDAFRRGFKPKDLWGSQIIIGGIWRKPGTLVSSARPCTELKKRFQNISRISCMKLLERSGIKAVDYITKSGTWATEPI